MHLTAMQNTEAFYDHYCSDLSAGAIVVDFGSYSVNGNLRQVFEPHLKYIGIDQAEGPNVDIVCNNRKTPFEDKSIDVAISSSCFEHDTCFWMTFLEMCRVVKPGGFIYINAPSAGPYHGHPGDCWRFYKDSWKALEEWAIENKYPLTLVEHYIDERNINEWHDSVGIFQLARTA
jgi:predicted SAM-dependent methyltransferase